MYQICSYFGEIDSLEIMGRSAILIFHKYFDAFSCKEYLLNTNNFKQIKNDKMNIIIKWYCAEDEHKIPKNFDKKIKKDTFSNKKICDPSTISKPNNYHSNTKNINNLNHFNHDSNSTKSSENELKDILSNNNLTNKPNYNRNTDILATD